MNRLLISIYFCFFTTVVSAETYVLAFHRSPPYSDFSTAGKPIGMVMEITNALSDKLGVQFTTLKCPLARCLVSMKEGSADLIMGVIKNDEREAFMSYVEPPYYTIDPAFAFYKQQERDFEIENYQQLKRYTIAVTRGGAYFERFDKDERLHKVDSLSADNQLLLLLKGRVDLVISVESTMDFTIASLGIKDKVSKVAYKARSPVSAYMAISHRSPLLQKRDALSDAIRALRKDGQLATILKRYNIQDVDQLL